MVEPRAVAEPTVRRAASGPVRTRILEAALEVFAEVGFEGGRTRDIARRAGVSQPLLGYHFESKDLLWRAAVDEGFARAREALAAGRREVGSADRQGRLRASLRSYLAFLAGQPHLLGIITLESRRATERTTWMVQTHIEPMFRAMADLLDDLVAEGALPAVDPVAFWYLVNAAGAPALLAPEVDLMAGWDARSSDGVDRVVDAVMALLFAAR